MRLISRRSLLTGAGAVAISSSKLLAMKDSVGTLQRAYVAKPQIIKQECPEWCWAASTAMIFAAHGHRTDQKKIVAKVFGGLACKPAGTPLAIAQALSAPWVDDSGQSFQASISAAYDPTDGIMAISNNFIINELANDRPVLYCNTHHAMVIVDFNYVMSPMGPAPQQVGVLDPWPGSPDYHPLSQPEMYGINMAPGGQMTFLAAVAL